MVYAITLWRVWRQEHLPRCPGFTLLAARELFAPQTLSIAEGRSLRVKLSPAGLRPLRERWESAPAEAYREPITHAEVLDGLSLIIENELSPLRWRHVPPWLDAGAVRPLSASAATERRAPRLWLFPLEHGKLEFEPLHPQDRRSWTGGFVMKLAEPMTPDHRNSLEAELRKIAQLVVERREPGPSRDVLLFPELCLDAQGVVALRGALREAGANPALVIAGSHHALVDNHPPLLRALTPIYADSEDVPLWCHQKRGPFRTTGKEWMDLYPTTDPQLPHDAELWEHILPGDTFTTFDGPGGRMGVLICSDLLEERFPAMRDLVRIALVDLLLVVNYSFKTTLFMRHAEQLNRLGICAVFLNAAGAIGDSALPRSSTERHPMDPFSALVALPQLALPGANALPTWLTWRYKDRRVEARVKRDWGEAQACSGVAELHDPAALIVDLNAWLPEPTPVDPVTRPLEQQITEAFKELPSRYTERISALRAAESEALPALAESISPDAQKLLRTIQDQGLFEPTKKYQGEDLRALMNLRLARPHRLAAPPTPPPTTNQSLNVAAEAPKEDTKTSPGIAESSFLVSLTPLGDALATWLSPPDETPTTPDPTPAAKRSSLRPTGKR